MPVLTIVLIISLSRERVWQCVIAIQLDWDLASFAVQRLYLLVCKHPRDYEPRTGQQLLVLHCQSHL
jgi:hypothetical protein